VIANSAKIHAPRQNSILSGWLRAVCPAALTTLRYK